MSAISFVRLLSCMGFPGGSDGKESTHNSGDPASITGLGRSPGKGNDNPFQYSCLENPHGQRSLVGYSPWGCKESDMTEQLTLLHYHSWTYQNKFVTCLPGTFFSALLPLTERREKKGKKLREISLTCSVQFSRSVVSDSLQPHGP